METKIIIQKMTDQKLKKEWVKALNSKKYRQGRGFLRKMVKNKKDGYCCLGVLCDIIDTTGWNNGPSTVFNYNGNNTSLTNIISQNIGMGTSTEKKLVKMNDGVKGWKDGKHIMEVKPKTFKTIANWIEKNL